MKAYVGGIRCRWVRCMGEYVGGRRCRLESVYAD